MRTRWQPRAPVAKQIEDFGLFGREIQHAACLQAITITSSVTDSSPARLRVLCHSFMKSSDTRPVQFQTHPVFTTHTLAKKDISTTPHAHHPTSHHDHGQELLYGCGGGVLPSTAGESLPCPVGHVFYRGLIEGGLQSASRVASGVGQQP
jgi:hypothetical protein